MFEIDVSSIDVVREMDRWVVDGVNYPLTNTKERIEDTQKQLVEEWQRLEALKAVMKEPEHKDFLEALHTWYDSRRYGNAEEGFVAGYMAAKGEK